jgi:hypothetical protein
MNLFVVILICWKISSFRNTSLEQLCHFLAGG